MTSHYISAVPTPNRIQQRNRELLEDDHRRRLDNNLTPLQRQLQHYPSKHYEIEQTIHIEQPPLFG